MAPTDPDAQLSLWPDPPARRHDPSDVRILIVDDEPRILALVRRLLEPQGYVCETAEGGPAALARLDGFKPNVILTDFQMPVLSGLDILKEVQARSLPSGVIVMTASVDVAPAIEAIRLGAYEYLLKPFNESDLLMSLERVLLKQRLLFENERYHRYLEKTFRRYVDPAVLKALTASFDLPDWESRKLTATVLFADIRGFSDLVGEMDVRDLIPRLNENYFGPATDILMELGGTVDKFLGDGVMAVFGAPTPFAGSASNAVEAAVRLVRRVRSGFEAGRHPFQVGVGVATGELLCGNIGSPRRMDFTVMGNTVNLAARLEKAAGSNLILIDETTRAGLGDAHRISPGIDLMLKGQKGFSKVFQAEA